MPALQLSATLFTVSSPDGFTALGTQFEDAGIRADVPLISRIPMSLKCGIVGLPGKSPLFNALTKAGIPAENHLLGRPH